MRNKIFKEKNKRIFLLCLMLLLGSKSFAQEVIINGETKIEQSEEQIGTGVFGDPIYNLFIKDSDIKVGTVTIAQGTFIDKKIFLFDKYNSNKLTLENFNYSNTDNEVLNGIYTSFKYKTDISEKQLNENELIIKNSKIDSNNWSFSIITVNSPYLAGNIKSSSNNRLCIDNSSFENVYDITVGATYIGDNVEISKGNTTVLTSSKFLASETEIFGSYVNGTGRLVEGNRLEITKSTFGKNKSSENNLYGGKGDNVIGNIVIVNEGNIFNGNTNIYGGYSSSDSKKEIKNNKVIINGDVKGNVYGAYSFVKEVDDINDFNGIEINSGKIIGDIYGAYIDNGVSNKTGIITNNYIKVLNNVDLNEANLYGYKYESGLYNDNIYNNNLIIDNFTGKINSINNFNNIVFENLVFNPNSTIITLNQQVNLSKTGIDVSFAGGQDFEKGSSMNLINNATGYQDSEINDEVTSTAGVSQNIIGSITNEDNNIKLTIKDIQLNNQVNLLSENHAVATAFINQGTDLISDSLDSISRDGKYGLKTFASTYGNHSEYDVNSDLKINGWSIIAGVGSEEKLNKGDFAWGLFFENGNGNYRTYNQFNEEFFRGDGSIKYNGLGLMSRFEYNNGVYTEGSFRIGRLESETIDALKDGTGNTYDTKSESLYYGAHLGLGKLISLGDNTEIDIFGKVFHTYTDEDSFNVAGDRFEFDSITSDRVRVGTRLNMNKKDLFKVYCGLAYEYEFNGDSNMKVQDMLAPEQSLEGSTYITELGINFKPSITSLWDFDINVRGYMGEREGFSGTLQATYTF